MVSFDINEFLEMHSNISRKPKWQGFFDYLDITFGENKWDDDILGALDVNDFVNSLKMYCVGNSKSQNTAYNYLTYLKELFKKLDEVYGIKNDIFDSRKKMQELDDESKSIINKLKPSEPKNMLTDEDYETMLCYLKGYFSRIDVENVLDNYYNHKKKQFNEDDYYVYVTAIMTYYMLKIPVSNQNIVNLKIDIYNPDNSSLMIDNYYIRIDDEFNKRLQKYVSIRDRLLQMLGKESDFMFIDENCKQILDINGNPDNAKIAYHLRKAGVSQSIQEIQKRIIYQMLDIGISSNTVRKISDVKDRAFDKILQQINKDENDKILVNDFFTGFKEEINQLKKRGFIKCPCCGKEVEAISKNLVLIKRKGQSELYLACQVCKGERWGYD